MRKDALGEWRRTSLLIAVGVFLIAPSLFCGIPRGNDLPHHYRVGVSFYDSIANGSLYPGWNALASNGYGDVSFRFYPPLLYYLLSGSRALTGNWYHGSLLLFTILSAVGGLGAYRWARTLLPRNDATVAGIFYLIAPYHINQIYQAFLLGEYAASSVLPFSFAFTELICRKGRARDLLCLSASYAALILTHLPLAVIGSIALLIYALLRMDRKRIRQTLFKLALAVALALGASAFYWVTMITELPWMRGNHINPNPWFDYRYNFLFWKTADGSPNWWANILAIATFLMFLPGLVLRRRRSGEGRDGELRAVGLLTVFSLLMTLPISEPLWSIFPPLKEVQFPWRWLAVASLTGTLVVASTCTYWRERSREREKGRPLAMLAAACIIIPLALSLSQTIRGATYIARPQFDDLISGVAQSDSLPDWLPVWAGEQARVMAGEIEIEQRAVMVDSWEAEHRVFRVAPGIAGEARVRTYYYPHWIARAGGKPLKTRADTDGALLIDLPESGLSITLEFQEPARRHLSIIVSVIAGCLLAGGLIFISFKRERLIWKYQLVRGEVVDDSFIVKAEDPVPQ